MPVDSLQHGVIIEPKHIIEFRTWMTANGAYLDPHVRYAPVDSGHTVITVDALEAETTIVTCPFSLVITPNLSRTALLTLLQNETIISDWSERQLICAYICFHWILEPERYDALAHAPYLRTLPPLERLRTPLHFTSTELDALKGTNLYGATLDRRNEWEKEWSRCQTSISQANRSWADSFTWDRYLTAATYLSSRAFPSTLLAHAPSLVTGPSSYPVLLPGVDALNHARAHPISWIVNFSPSDGKGHNQKKEAAQGSSTLSSRLLGVNGEDATISLVNPAPIPALSELFNNYGPKPNSELILGYGFSIRDNPDDTIVLRIGGATTEGKKWEVGRDARGVEGVWDEILHAVREAAQAEGEEGDIPTWSLTHDAAATLQSMSSALLLRLPGPPQAEIRSEVAEMIKDYVTGQREILTDLVRFAEEKEAEAIMEAKREGVKFLEGVDEEEETQEY